MEKILELGNIRIIQYWFYYKVKFLLGLTAVMTVLTLVIQLFTFGYFGEMIGLLSMGIESTLGFPQLINNFKTKSVKGLSIQMIGLWFVGDFAKTIYFIMEVHMVRLRLNLFNL